MKTAIVFLILLCGFVFACDGKQDIYVLKTDSGFKILLTNRGEPEISDSIFNLDYPQYANKTKTVLYAGINKETDESIYSVIRIDKPEEITYRCDFATIRKIVVIR